MHGAASQKNSYGSFKNTECFGSISLNSQFFGVFFGGEGGDEIWGNSQIYIYEKICQEEEKTSSHD